MSMGQSSENRGSFLFLLTRSRNWIGILKLMSGPVRRVHVAEALIYRRVAPGSVLGSASSGNTADSDRGSAGDTGRVGRVKLY